jgi:hypothetical protein
MIKRQFPCGLRLAHQAFLEAGICNVQQGRDHVLVGAAAQVGDAIFGRDDIAQVAWNGDVTVVPQNIRADAAVLLAGAAQRQYRSSPGQGMCHRHEIELTADTAHHLPVGQTVRHGGAAQFSAPVRGHRAD